MRPSHAPAPPPADASRYRAARVARFVSPYGVRDQATVVVNNLRGRPTSRHAAATPFLPRPFRLRDITPTLRIGFLGDLMPCGPAGFTLDPSLIRFFADIDVAVVNFEGTTWEGPGPPPKVLWAQRHHDLTVLEALDPLGLPPERVVVSVANNHAADFGFDNFLRCRDRLAARGHPVIGARWDAAVRVHAAVSIAAVTQWSNQRHDYLAPLDEADRWAVDGLCNVLVPHWANEFETHPRPATRAAAARLAQRWDAIVGHHSHVPGAVATATATSGRTAVVAYSLGDAATSMRYPFYRHGLALRLDLGPDPSGAWAVGGGSYSFTRIVGDPPRLVAADGDPWFPGV